MRRIAILLLAACDPDPIAAGDAGFDLAQARSLALEDGGIVDFAVALPQHCPCPANSYCDLATNSCKAGCLGNDQCPSGSLCDTQLFQCVAVCDPKSECPNHVPCKENKHGFYVCSGCDSGYDDCNHDPSDGCETPLNTDANCSKCGGPPNVVCYQDKDGDRYVVSSITSTHCGSCPTGQTAASQMMMGEDCDDNDPRVYPDQTVFFTTATSTGGWDFNCDGFVEYYIQREIYSGCGDLCDAGFTWTSKAPNCGEFGQVTQCLDPPGGSCHTAKYTDSTAQSCR
jgi:hypothetical protein